MKLTDSQFAILSKAAQRSDHYIEIPKAMSRATAEKLVAKLSRASLIEEIESIGGSPVWRTVEDQPYSLRITGKGMEAIAITSDSRTKARAQKKPEHTRTMREKLPTKSTGQKPKSTLRHKDSAVGPNSRRPRTTKAKKINARAKTPGTKIAQILNLLSRKRGATIDEIATATGWQVHSVRGALSGAIRKKLGHKITTEKHNDTRHHRIDGARG